MAGQVERVRGATTPSWWKKGLGLASPLIAERARYFAAEPYRTELIELHRKARALGFQTPAEPEAANEPSLPTGPSLPNFDEVKTYAKYGAIGLAAVLGVVVISNVASATRR